MRDVGASCALPALEPTLRRASPHPLPRTSCAPVWPGASRRGVCLGPRRGHQPRRYPSSRAPPGALPSGSCVTGLLSPACDLSGGSASSATRSTGSGPTMLPSGRSARTEWARPEVGHSVTSNWPSAAGWIPLPSPVGGQAFSSRRTRTSPGARTATAEICHLGCARRARLFTLRPAAEEGGPGADLGVTLEERAGSYRSLRHRPRARRPPVTLGNTARHALQIRRDCKPRTPPRPGGRLRRPEVVETGQHCAASPSTAGPSRRDEPPR